MNLFNKQKSAILFSCLLLTSQLVLAVQADRTKPINLEADNVTLDDLHKVSVYTGNVSLVQGTMVVRADKIEVRQDGEGFSKAVAYGNPVYFKQKRENADDYIEGYASRVDMDNKRNTVQLTGNARLKKGADELSGNSMNYNTLTEFFEVKNDPNAAKGSSAVPSRVHAVIHPTLKSPSEPVQPTPGVTPQPKGDVQPGQK